MDTAAADVDSGYISVLLLFIIIILHDLCHAMLLCGSARYCQRQCQCLLSNLLNCQLPLPNFRLRLQMQITDNRNKTHSTPTVIVIVMYNARRMRMRMRMQKSGTPAGPKDRTDKAISLTEDTPRYAVTNALRLHLHLHNFAYKL